MIYIVTPCWNAVETIEQTILSVLTQAGNFDITYHIQDGGSTDGTVELISRWISRVDLGLFPIQCRSIKFTYNSGSDSGMYDAIVSGFGQETAIDSNAFMTWINADDILMPGALALIEKLSVEIPPELVSWIGGAVNVICNNIPMEQHHRQTPTAIIASGLCDGQHWPFVQQEGVFFRKWLWDKIDAPNVLKTFKYAGDWNLWRLFAKHAEYIHFPYPLAAFRLSASQLSAVHFEDYMVEIEAILGEKDREQRLRIIGEATTMNKRMLEVSYPTARISIVEQSALLGVDYHYIKKFKESPSRKLPSTEILGKKQVIYKAPRNGGITINNAEDLLRSPTQSIQRIVPHEFDNFTYAKHSHWALFDMIDVSLYGKRMKKGEEQLKVYQDLLVLKFITDNIPPGSRILDVGGGKSRILNHLANTYECWNIDKLDGVGNGPKNIGKHSYKLVQDYIGNYNSELKNEYFDLVFSISALEHVPQDDSTIFDNIILDIQRVLKVGGYSLHLFDIVLKQNYFWTNKITDYIFNHVNTINKNTSYKTIKADRDLYAMSEAAYNKTWRHNTNKSYKEHGAPSSLNILWQKEK